MLQASIEDVGTYKIILKSVVPPYNHTIYFDIVMYEAKECPISTVCTDTSVIALIVVSVYAVIATIAAGAISWKLHKKSPKKKNSKGRDVQYVLSNIKQTCTFEGFYGYLHSQTFAYFCLVCQAHLLSLNMGGKPT